MPFGSSKRKMEAARSREKMRQRMIRPVVTRPRKARLRKKRLGQIPVEVGNSASPASLVIRSESGSRKKDSPVDLAVKRAEKKNTENTEKWKNREMWKKREIEGMAAIKARQSLPLFTKEEIDEMHKNLDERRRLQREALDEAVKRGWSRKEFSLCGNFLYKRDFEKKSILSADEMELKAYLDLVRDTKGYGVDVLPPDYDPEDIYAESPLDPQRRYWEIFPSTQTFVKDVEEAALLKIKEGFGKTYQIEDLEFVNLVEKDWHYLLTFKLPTTDTDQEELVVEAICFSRQQDLFEFDEVKIRKGSTLLFSSVEVTLSDYPLD